jgi:catechol 2,3-dioxygenase-like lactoylglutathione lyase family enzyme
MITSIHTLIYFDDAQATRAFLRDVLGWKYVAEDWDNRVNRFAPRGLSQCGDRARWVIVPGANDMQLYQPTHKLAYNL